MDSTCAEGEVSATVAGLRLARGSRGEAFAELAAASGRQVLRGMKDCELRADLRGARCLSDAHRAASIGS